MSLISPNASKVYFITAKIVGISLVVFTSKFAN